MSIRCEKFQLTTLTVASAAYVVQMDTGSADLWIYAPNDNLKLTNQSGITTNLTYGVGSAEGEIVFGELKLGNHTIPSQGKPRPFLPLCAWD